MKIINPWKKTPSGKFTEYDENNLVFSYGEYSIYCQWQGAWLYVFKNMAFNCLARLDKQHLINVAERSGEGFLYDRAMDNLREHGIE